MLLACLPLFVTLLVGLPSTVTAQTLDHQQLDTSGGLGTNPASPGDFGGKHLSKHPTHSVQEPHELREYKNLPVKNFPNDIFKMHSNLNRGAVADLQTNSYSGNPNRVRIGSSFSEMYEKADNSSTLCPDPAAIVPCICNLEIDELWLHCSYVDSLDQLAEVFRQDCPVIEFDLFWIDYSENIQYITDVFNGISFRSIILNMVPKLAEISKYAFFDSIDTLESLYIFESGLDENTFPFSTLAEFPNLVDFTIGGSNLTIFPAFVSSSIQSIEFYIGQVSSLPAGEKCCHMIVVIFT